MAFHPGFKFANEDTLARSYGNHEDIFFKVNLCMSSARLCQVHLIDYDYLVGGIPPARNIAERQPTLGRSRKRQMVRLASAQKDYSSASRQILGIIQGTNY